VCRDKLSITMTLQAKKLQQVPTCFLVAGFQCSRDICSVTIASSCLGQSYPAPHLAPAFPVFKGSGRGSSASPGGLVQSGCGGWIRGKSAPWGGRRICGGHGGALQAPRKEKHKGKPTKHVVAGIRRANERTQKRSEKSSKSGGRGKIWVESGFQISPLRVGGECPANKEGPCWAAGRGVSQGGAARHPARRPPPPIPSNSSGTSSVQFYPRRCSRRRESSRRGLRGTRGGV